MSIRRFFIFSVVFTIITASTLSAQFFGGGGGRPGSNNIFGVAGSASPGREITVGGRLTPYRKVEHSASVEGYVDSLPVKLGDRVSVGSPLVRISRNVVGETYLPVVVESRIDGIVSDIKVYRNELVTSGTSAVTILDDRFYLLKASLSDRDALAVRRLGALAVQGKTPEGDSFPGTIEELSTEPDYTTGLFTLTIAFPRNRNLYLGAVLFVDLPVEKPAGIIIDATAVFTDGGASFVWIINKDSQLEKKAVTPGALSDTGIAIDKGIASGDRYLRKPGGQEKEGMSIRDLVQANMAGSGSTGGN